MTAQNRTGTDLFLVLEEKEKAILMTLLFFADNTYDEYVRKMEKVIRYLDGVRRKYEYLSEEDPKYEGVYRELDRLVERLKNKVYELPSPYKWINDMLREREK